MARNFNGTTDKIVLSGVPTTVVNGISISCWIKPVTFGNNQIMFQTGNTNINGYGIAKQGSSRALGFARDGIAFSFSSYIITDGVWTQVGLTYNTATNGTLNFYAGGALVAGPLTNQGIPTAPTTQGTIGTGDGGGTLAPFKGAIADVAIWTVQLTATEWAGLGAGIRPYNIREASLAGYWPVDGLASPEPDLSGFKNNGTVTGTTLAFGPPFAPFTPRWPMGAILPSTIPPAFILMPQIAM